MAERICIEDGCTRIWLAQKLCHKHYMKRRYHGALTKVSVLTLAERLAKESRREGDCIVWTGCRDANGYGLMTYQRRRQSTHRLAWADHYGPIPAETPIVCHRCDNPPCMNLEHLFLGTQADNVADMWTKRRGSRGEGRPNAILTAEMIPDIRRRAAAGEMHKDIAASIGITANAIGRVVRGETWKHVS